MPGTTTFQERCRALWASEHHGRRRHELPQQNDVVIVADNVLREFMDDGLVLKDSYKPLVRAIIGMAVREG